MKDALRALALAAAVAAPAAAGPFSGFPADPAIEPLLREVEARQPACRSVEEADIRVPTKVLSLGISTKLYQCWQLKLTGSHGVKVLETMTRLKSLQDALKAENAELQKALLQYQAAPKPAPLPLQRLAARSRAASDILAAYRTLAESGTRNGLIRISESGLLNAKTTITPRLRDDDYTMTYDDSKPECPSAEGQR
ncbi:MAG TPA: hypothetical protein DCM05_05425 [Elusimicrobia bacterium]|nr:hypothetical protein [Elusimicrobiota bacterium]